MISCSRCKAYCCTWIVELVGGLDDIPDHLTEEVHDYGAYILRMKRQRDGYCAALDRDTFKCTIYQQRPIVCKQFEVGSSGCKEARNMLNEPVLEDDYPIYNGYLYVADGKVIEAEHPYEEGCTALQYKRLKKIKELRRCDMKGRGLL